ncbi:universal stress protein [Azotobacter vinelandii]
MFSTALVAVDLFDRAPASNPLLACLPELRNLGVSRIVLVHIAVTGHSHAVAFGHEQYYLAELEICAQPLRSAGLQVDLVVRDASSAADTVLKIANEVAADLLVIGSRSQNVVTRLFLGSTARQIIRKTTLPLLLEWIEPCSDEACAECAAVCSRLPGKVLLATDFSRHAGGAERVAISLAQPGREIDCLHVMTQAQKEAIPAWPLMARAALEDLLRQIGCRTGIGRPILEDGEPAETIALVAQGGDYSLVVVGKHGQNWIESMLIGSTAATVCETAGRPVLMVPLAMTP